MKRSGKPTAILAALFAAAVLLTGCGRPAAPSGASSGAKNEKFSSTLRIGYISGAKDDKIITSIVGWAQKNGYFESEFAKHGVTKIEYTGFVNGPNLNEALASNSVDVGANIGDTPAVNGRSAGIKTRLIAIDEVADGVYLVAKKGGPKTLNDLKGKKIATAQGSYMSKYLLGVIKEAGIENDVTVLHILPPDAKAALSRGDIAAYAYPAGFAQLVTADGSFVSIDDTTKHPTLAGDSVTLVTESYLAANPGFPKVWNDIRAKAYKEAAANKDKFLSFYADANGYTFEGIKESYPFDTIWHAEAFTDDGLAILNSTKKFLLEQKIAKNDFSVDSWIYK